MSVHVCRDFLFLNGKCDNPKKVAVPEPVDQFAQVIGIAIANSLKERLHEGIYENNIFRLFLTETHYFLFV